MDEKEKELRLKMADMYPRILAKDTEEGKEYLTAGMLYKIKVIKINGTDIGCTNVTVESESNLNNKQLNISGGTELIVYDKDLHVPADKVMTTGVSAEIPTSPKVSNNSKEAKSEEKKITTLKKVPNMNKINMSSIINPLLMEGKSADEIADAVIKAIPENGNMPEKASLIRQIRGPRRYNLIKKLEKDGVQIPKHLLEKEKEKK